MKRKVQMSEVSSRMKNCDDFLLVLNEGQVVSLVTTNQEVGITMIAEFLAQNPDLYRKVNSLITDFRANLN